jgi:hypothetical protein
MKRMLTKPLYECTSTLLGRMFSFEQQREYGQQQHSELGDTRQVALPSMQKSSCQWRNFRVTSSGNVEMFWL